jgi:peroxiredoxin
MNLLKSMFMTAYMMAAMAVSAYAAWRLAGGGMRLEWLGVMLTVAPITMVLAGLMLTRNVAQTHPHMPLIQLMALAGLGLAAWAWHAGQGGAAPLLLAGAGWAGLLLYVYGYSRFGREPSMRLVIGAALPEFTVTGVDGRAFSSRSLVGKPSVLVFYRGNWCPFCMAQVKQLASRYRELDELGVRVALISPQPYDKNRQLAARFGVNFEFLTDRDNAAARILELEDRHGLPMGMQMMGYDSDTVLPTVIITDRDGKVRWVHETDSYRIRPEPDTYLEVLRGHGIAGAALPAAALTASGAV